MFRTRAILIVILALLASGRILAALAADTARLDAATMRAALRTTTAEENCFIDYVLAKVGKGVLPAVLVESTFQWARKKPYKHRFQYFKYGLLVRAEKLGIKL